MVLDRPASRQRVWFFADKRKDRRRLFSRLSVVLEHRRILSLRTARSRIGVNRHSRLFINSHFHPDALFVSVATRAVQSPDDCAGRNLDAVVDVDFGAREHGKEDTPYKNGRTTRRIVFVSSFLNALLVLISQAACALKCVE